MEELNEITAAKDPFKQFEAWFKRATEANLPVANAMTLSTVNAAMRPSSRVVLLQSFSKAGFVFYTNYQSRKGKEIEHNPFCCACFFWPELQQQVRIEGKLEKVSPQVSDAYFMSRPHGSRLGAWTSPQSEIIPGRKMLEEKLETVTREFSGKEVSRPGWWGGYAIIPDRFEFWQERESRLHDRIVYQEQPDGTWKMARLAP